MSPSRRFSLTRRGALAAGVAAPAAALAEPVRLADFGIREGMDIGPALQRAIDATGGAPVVVPAGRYRIETPVVVKAGARGRGDDLSVSRQPGPTIVGAGTKRTTIDCAVTGGAPFMIDQARPYAFTVDSRIEGMTLNGVAGVAGQDGIRLSGAWGCTLEDVEIVGFSGHGVSAPWREDLGWTLTGIVLEAGSTLARRAAGLGTVTGVTAGHRVRGPGIAPDTRVARMVDYTTIELTRPADASMVSDLLFVGNSDAFQTILTTRACRFVGNRGWGIHGGAAIGLTLEWIACEAQGNRAGGLYCAGTGWRLSGGAVYDNGIDGGCGLKVERVWGSPAMLRIDNIEFDSNYGTQVWLKDAHTVAFTQTRFISHYYDDTRDIRAPAGVTLGDPGGQGAATRVRFDQCHFRSPLVPPGAYACVRFGRRGTYDAIDLTDSFWISRQPGHRFFESPPASDATVTVREAGRVVFASRPTRVAIVLEKAERQAIPPGVATEIVFDRMVAGDAPSTPARESSIEVDVSGIRATGIDVAAPRRALPVVAVADQGAFASATIAPADGTGWGLSSAVPAGRHRVVVGGAVAPHGDVYEIEASLTLEGGSLQAVARLAVTVGDRVRRQMSWTLTGAAPTTISIRAVVPVSAEARIGLRLWHDAAASVTVVGGPESGGFSVLAVS